MAMQQRQPSSLFELQFPQSVGIYNSYADAHANSAAGANTSHAPGSDSNADAHSDSNTDSDTYSDAYSNSGGRTGHYQRSVDLLRCWGRSCRSRRRPGTAAPRSRGGSMGAPGTAGSR